MMTMKQKELYDTLERLPEEFLDKAIDYLVINTSSFG